MYALKVFVLCAAAARIAAPQESIHYASIGGRVADPSGGVVEGALVSARHTDTNLTATANTGGDGRFRFSFLRVGTYEIRAAKTGFGASVQLLEVKAGSAFELPLTLALEVRETTVVVNAEAAALETARTQVAGTISQTEIGGLPLNGRSFLDLALLIPGVSPTNTGSNQLFAETSAVPGQGISVGSQRNFSNNFIVDGLSANDDAAGLSGVSYGLDTVHELQVVTSGGQAELGRALGGYINVVTRSGTNSMHGDLYGYFRNQRFNAANPLSNTTLPSTQAQYGASLGGPVVRDRTFYFANFEHRRLNQSGLITISPQNIEAINARLAAVGYRGSPIATGLYPNPVHTTNVLSKLDHQVSASDQFSLRHSLYGVNSRNSRGAGALSAATASSGLDSSDHTIAAANIFTISPRTVNETRAQFTYSNLDALPGDPVGPAVSISGVATFGRLSNSPTGRLNRLYEVVDSLSHHSGAHAFRAGANFLYNDSVIAFPRAIVGSYSFSSLANFLDGAYNNLGFTQTFGPSVVAQGNSNLGVYAQDEWKIGSRLTLNLGVRYDLQFLRTISTDANNIAPRAGFAWTPFASRRTVIRGGFGLFYDRIPLRALANALLSAGNTTTLDAASQVSVALAPSQTGAPVFPNIIGALPEGVLANFTTMNRDIRNAYSTQGNFEIEQQIGSRATVSAAYQYLRGVHLIATINRNAPRCAASGNNNGCRTNPNYANNSQYSAAGDSNYHGLHLSFVQRPVKWGGYRISYTFSKSLNNVGEFFFSQPIDPYNIWRDYGRSDDDQRHRVVFDGSLRAPLGFQLSGMLQYYSAPPLNITTGTTTIQGTAARPTVNGGFIGRNTGTGNDFFSAGARLSRSIRLTELVRLEAIAESFNLLNHRNNLARNGTFGTGAFPASPAPQFGQVTSVHDPRSFQFALRLRF